MRERRGTPPSRRAAASARRRDEILAAALECFTVKGYAATTIEDVRARSGASNGSIYHHFGSKEHLAAALYLDALSDYQYGLLAELERHADAEDGVRAVVRYHVDWAWQHEALARFLAHRPLAVRLVTNRDTDEQNRQLYVRALMWVHEQVDAGALRQLPEPLYYAVWLGPAHEYVRDWLEGRIPLDPADAVPVLADAAWAALRPAGEPAAA